MDIKDSLVDEEARYRGIFCSVSDSIIIYDINGKIVEVNPKSCQTYGYTHDEFLRLSGKDLMHPHCYHMFDYFLKELKKSKSFFGEALNVRKDGSIFNVEIKGSIFSLNSVTHFLSIVRDITERKRSEKVQQEYMDKLEQLVEERTKEVKEAEHKQMEAEKMAALGLIAAGVAHEINNPLGALSGGLEVLKEKFFDNPPVFESLSKLTRRVDRIAKIINDLLFYSREKTVNRIRCNINKTIRDSIESFQDFIKKNYNTSQKEVIIKKKLQLKLPLITLDSDQIIQVFSNLLKNAYEAIAKKGTIIISSFLSQDKKYIFIKFTDTGEGIPEENLKNIFIPFFTTKDVDKGTGLGLFICDSIVKAHNGNIEVESKVGIGTTFTIKLPVNR